MTRGDEHVDHYGASYGHFAAPLYAEIRAETFGEDIGQNGWLTAVEQDLFIDGLALGAGDALLDVACGSGGPTLRIARATGCTVHGVDAHAGAIAHARVRSEREGLAPRASFACIDASESLPMADASFDGIICIDAINHLPDRPRIFADWARLLRRGGRLVLTDPVVITGPITSEEIAVRSSVGFFLFVPDAVDVRMLEAAGLAVVETLDRTENMAQIAARWGAARAARERELREVEGDATFEGQQRFFEIAARLASERRLSRIAYRAVRR